MKQIILLSISFLLFNCASTSRVNFEYDTSVNFKKFSTFVICYDDLFVENTKYPNYDNKYVRQLLADAFETKMENFGHKTNVFNPELQVGFKIVVNEEEIKFQDCEDHNDIGYWELCKIKTETYTTETLIAYVAHFENNQVIWQATIPTNFNKSKNNLPKYINEVTNLLFKNYPKK